MATPFLSRVRSSFPGSVLAFLQGFSTIRDKKSIFVYWNATEGAYMHVKGNIVRSAEDIEADDFIPLPDLSQEDAMRILAITTPGASDLRYTIQEETPLEIVLLRLAILHQPNMNTLTARQETLVAPFRPPAHKKARA